MKRLTKHLILPGTLLSSVLLSVACSSTSNKESEFEETNKIVQILNKTSLNEQLPKIEFLKPDDKLTDYTSEALDCLEKLIGAQIYDPVSNTTLISRVAEVIQNPGFGSADIKVQWAVKNSTLPAYYVKTYHMSGFKPIPLNHTHFVKTKQKVPCQVCLLKYNGQKIITLDTLLKHQAYSNDLVKLNATNISQQANLLKDQFKFKDNIEPFIESTFYEVAQELIKDQEFVNQQTISIGQLDLKILTSAGKSFFQMIQASLNPVPVLESGINFISSYFQDLNLDSLQGKDLLFALYVKFWAHYNLEINFGEFNNEAKKIWILSELISFFKFTDNNSQAQKLQELLNQMLGSNE
ncbi:hypothetical protein [Mycoplasma sp. 3686d]|uniref:hypothetical protein n=1 Tax=Mycoplasma sp. 3686d TaxID=2967300 RepID=UPI00211BD963|nr:hypothetical protein [Mycoplasma sp. 3686d]UUM25017.1 hypothetical protein NPA12_01230 [Mycoplasma sp. 3686d]